MGNKRKLKKLTARTMNDDGALNLTCALVKQLQKEIYATTVRYIRAVKRKKLDEAEQCDIHIDYLKYQCRHGLLATIFALLKCDAIETLFREYDEVRGNR